MSLRPFIFSNWWEDLKEPHRLLHQHLGSQIHPEILTPSSIPMLATVLGRGGRKCPMAEFYNSPWGELLRKSEDGTSTVTADKDKFQVVLDVQQFEPEEINVKVVDQYIVVEAKHEEKQDEHGWISRQFTRRYIIPEQCDIEQVSSKLSSDGILSISVARKEKPADNGERVINIEHTGRPAVLTRKVKNPEEKMEEEN